MKLFVAGATGVLGRVVVRKLRERGHEVRGLARSDANEERLRLLGAEPARCDLFDAPSLSEAVRGCEAVLHLATSIPRRRRQRLKDFALNDRIRTEGTRNLLAAALAARARRYVQQSIAILLEGAGGEWVDEEAPLKDHPRLQSAVEMERLVWQSQGLEGMSTVILRGGWFYGHEADSTRQIFAALRSGFMPLPGAGENFWSLIHVDDMAQACVAVTEFHRPDPVYLAVDNEPVQVRELFSFVAGAQGGPPPRRWPAWLVRAVTGPLVYDMLSASFRCRNDRLRRQTGWSPAYPTYRHGVEAILRAWAEGGRPR